MQVFRRELISTHCVGWEWPTFVGKVALGESFKIETVESSANGPVEVDAVHAGEDLAIHIERIEFDSQRFYAPNGGPLMDGKPLEIEYSDGWFHWPEHFVLQSNPSVGCVAVLPARTDEIREIIREIAVPWGTIPNESGWRRAVRAPRDKHCHQDCQFVTKGSVVHIKAQVDGAGVCLDDVHGYIGQGELAFAAIESHARVQIRVERSSGWHVDWPLIETREEIMVFSSYSSTYPRRPRLRYVDVVRQAYGSLVEVVAARAGCKTDAANSIVATAADIRNCAVYGLRGFVGHEKDTDFDWDIALVAALPKHIFRH